MKGTKSLHRFYWMILLCAPLPVYAALNIEITGAGEHQTPITIVPLAGEEKLTQSISSIVADDLARSGLFKPVKQADKSPHNAQEVDYGAWTGVDALAVGKAEVGSNGRITVKFSLLDTARKLKLLDQTVWGKGAEIRVIAHRISDLIYEKLTGDPGVFNTHIAFISQQGSDYKLVIADSDGYGEKIIFSSDSNIMSPAWSPDGSHLAFMAFEQNHAVVYVQSLLTNQRMAVSNLPENNSAPTWSPDGQQLALVLTSEGNSHIYLVRPDGSELQQMTFDDEIDTEPNFSPDGLNLIFASDRGGSVQIYQMPADGGDAERLTFEGNNNFSPHYSPDGKSFVFSSWVNGKFYIATEDFQSQHVQILTDGGWEENPSYAPNGKLILFATEDGASGRKVLSTVSIDGRVKQKLTSQQGDILDPVWGPQKK